ncbi:helix-turn-helix domain-containing protein [Bombilactobacillus folatiphilus]|uniref:Helix-turn-helix domain-containing protein n=1 Tax=Bombilactobacillus folatiphilus TaxID=2923362 RepID=A0ABY4PA11_9LACO|nr:helix-turn-helix transcriptional regulator [Bombilactobacillus folatiphilus]UQS82578.1 helix-turn-helix domain-containing protein [Bombilactobacillus folatiphilus]
MNIYQKIKDLAASKNISIAELERKLDLSNGSLYKWTKTSPSIDKVKLVANFFEVSTDYLLGLSNDRYSLSDKEKADVGFRVENILNGIETDDKVSFFGEPMDDEDKAAIKAALQTAVAINKEHAKKKRLNQNK